MAKSASSAPAKPTRTNATSTRKRKSIPARKTRLDFSKATVGKYYEAASKARNVVRIDADLLDTFPDAQTVNVALRSLKEIAQRTGQSSPPKRVKKSA